MDAILNISKRSMMPEWHQLDSSFTMPNQKESTKKKNFKIKFQVILVFYWTKPETENMLTVFLFVFVALRPMSTAMVIAGWSVHLTTLFPWQA